MARLLSRIAVRLLLFNVLLVFLPVAGLLSVRSLETQLLDLQERSMVQQGRVAAASLSAESEALSPDRARSLILRLGGRSEARIRIVDRAENVLADSATIAPPQMDSEGEYAESLPVSRRSLLYRAGVVLWRPLKRVVTFVRPAPASSRSRQAAEVTPRNIVRKALEGRYAATVQESAGQRSLTMYSALPIRAGESGEVIGVVVVSQSTSRILRALWRVRLDIFKVFVISVLVAGALSLIVSATIARPLTRLRDEADDLLDHRGRLRRAFRGTHRRDEIGELTRALEELTARLERHLAFVESFSADVTHELKNPLASIRSAAELLQQTDDAREKQQLGATIEKEVVRLNRLLNGVREITRIDAAVDTEPARPVDLRELLSEVSRESPARGVDRTPVDLIIPSHPVIVSAAADRLTQAVGNIVDNALSFSPPNARVSISLVEENNSAVIRVDDEGPGIPPEHLETVFHRFFSFRPDSAEGDKHDGLGLAIARAIVNGYGGSIAASNRAPRGARFEIRLRMA